MNLKTICKSIRDGNMIMFKYGDKDRVVEAHAIGVTAKDSLCFRAWQLGDEAGWRLFDVEKIDGEVTDTKLSTDGPRPGYKPNDSVFDTLILELELADA